MPTNRDIVRTEPSERIDRPDFDAVQRGGRADTRSHEQHFLFAGNARRVGGGWEVTAAGAPDATVTVAEGTGWGAVELDDGSFEYGVAFGLEGDASQVLDMTGKPNGTYGIWVRPSYAAGSQANRVFWDASAIPGTEIVAAMDTRYEAGWDAVAELVSPGDEYQKVADVAWAGAIVNPGDITMTRNMLFEGDEDGGFADAWGDGINDRDADRGAYGVTSLATWVQAVRRQLQDMIGGGGGWYTLPPYALQDAFLHAADDVDPHGSPLFQTDLTIANSITSPGYTYDAPKTRRKIVTLDNQVSTWNNGGTNPATTEHVLNHGSFLWRGWVFNDPNVAPDYAGIRLPVEKGETIDDIYLVFVTSTPGSAGSWQGTLYRVDTDSLNTATEPTTTVFAATINDTGPTVLNGGEDLWQVGWTSIAETVDDEEVILLLIERDLTSGVWNETLLYVIVDVTVPTVEAALGM